MGKPVLFVSHAGGDWQMYCDWRVHDFDDPAVLENDLKLTHFTHLAEQDATLTEVFDLPIDMAAERKFIGGSWDRYEDKDDS